MKSKKSNAAFFQGRGHSRVWARVCCRAPGCLPAEKVYHHEEVIALSDPPMPQNSGGAAKRQSGAGCWRREFSSFRHFPYGEGRLGVQAAPIASCRRWPVQPWDRPSAPAQVVFCLLWPAACIQPDSDCRPHFSIDGHKRPGRRNEFNEFQFLCPGGGRRV